MSSVLSCPTAEYTQSSLLAALCVFVNQSLTCASSRPCGAFVQLIIRCTCFSTKAGLQTLLQLPTTPRTCVCLYHERGTWRGKNYAFFGFEVKLKLVQDVWLETAGTSHTNLLSLSEPHKSVLVLAHFCASHEHTCTKVSLGLRLIMHASVYPATSLYCHGAL